MADEAPFDPNLDIGQLYADAEKAYEEGHNMAEQHIIQQACMFGKVMQTIVGKLGAAAVKSDEDLDRVTQLLDRSNTRLERLNRLETLLKDIRKFAHPDMQAVIDKELA